MGAVLPRRSGRRPYALGVAGHVVLLRGINIGSRNRISMPKLREVLVGAGFGDVATYVQSGNVVLASAKKADGVRRDVEQALANELGLEIEVVVRSRAELAKVVERDPLGDVATNPKRYQVTFLATKAPAGLKQKLQGVAAEQERFAISGREVYAWHPEGVARSKLWALLAGKELGVTGTSRNWTTVTRLLELAGG
jgi:uncharacterized protein (DUF1697 family)